MSNSYEVTYYTNGPLQKGKQIEKIECMLSVNARDRAEALKNAEYLLKAEKREVPTSVHVRVKEVLD